MRCPALSEVTVDGASERPRLSSTTSTVAYFRFPRDFCEQIPRHSKHDARAHLYCYCDCLDQPWPVDGSLEWNWWTVVQLWRTLSKSGWQAAENSWLSRKYITLMMCNFFHGIVNLSRAVESDAWCWMAKCLETKRDLITIQTQIVAAETPLVLGELFRLRGDKVCLAD